MAQICAVAGTADMKEGSFTAPEGMRSGGYKGGSYPHAFHLLRKSGDEEKACHTHLCALLRQVIARCFFVCNFIFGFIFPQQKSGEFFLRFFFKISFRNLSNMI